MKQELDVLQICKYVIQRNQAAGYPVNYAKLMRILFLIYCDWAMEYDEPLFVDGFAMKNDRPVSMPARITYMTNGSLAIYYYGDVPEYVLSMSEERRARLDNLINKWIGYTLVKLFKVTNEHFVVKAARNEHVEYMSWNYIGCLCASERLLSKGERSMRDITVSVGDKSYTLSELTEAVAALANAYDAEVEARDREVSYRLGLEKENERLKSENEALRGETLTKYCDCYHIENGIPRCYGTKERDQCSCDGRKANCTFYKETRKKYENVLYE